LTYNQRPYADFRAHLRQRHYRRSQWRPQPWTGGKQIILNLGDVTSVDSGGLGELVRTHTSAKNKGGAVKVANLPKRIQDLLIMTRLVTVFDTFDNEAAAIKSFGGS
jgi:anti-anti-sigma factor